MAEHKIIGEQVPLSQSPLEAVEKGSHAGSYHQVGEGVPLAETPVGGTEAGSHQGKMRNVGETVPLNFGR